MGLYGPGRHRRSRRGVLREYFRVGLVKRQASEKTCRMQVCVYVCVCVYGWTPRPLTSDKPSLSPFHQEEMGDACTSIDVVNLSALYKV